MSERLPNGPQNRILQEPPQNRRVLRGSTYTRPRGLDAMAGAVERTSARRCQFSSSQYGSILFSVPDGVCKRSIAGDIPNGETSPPPTGSIGFQFNLPVFKHAGGLQTQYLAMSMHPITPNPDGCVCRRDAREENRRIVRSRRGVSRLWRYRVARRGFQIECRFPMLPLGSLPPGATAIGPGLMPERSRRTGAAQMTPNTRSIGSLYI